MKRYLIVVFVFLLIYISYNTNFFEPTNYLECKNSRGVFYLKIIQSKNKAEEYPNSKYKTNEVIKSFNLNKKKNYIMLDNDGQYSPPKSITKTDDIFPINRKTLKIYDPIKRINLAECSSGDNKI
jgi:hypothetical protein